MLAPMSISPAATARGMAPAARRSGLRVRSAKMATHTTVVDRAATSGHSPEPDDVREMAAKKTPKLTPATIPSHTARRSFAAAAALQGPGREQEDGREGQAHPDP